MIGKLCMHPVGLKPISSPFTLLLYGEEVPFELELIGKPNVVLSLYGQNIFLIGLYGQQNIAHSHFSMIDYLLCM